MSVPVAVVVAVFCRGSGSRFNLNIYTVSFLSFYRSCINVMTALVFAALLTATMAVRNALPELTIASEYDQDWESYGCDLPYLLECLDCPWPDTDGPDAFHVPVALPAEWEPVLTPGTKEWEYMVSGRALIEGYRSFMPHGPMTEFGRNAFQRMSRSPNPDGGVVRLQNAFWAWIRTHNKYKLLKQQCCHVDC